MTGIMRMALWGIIMVWMLGSVVTAKPLDRIVSSMNIRLDGDRFMIATDAQNVGKEQKWFDHPRVDAKAATVPGVIQDVDPNYHGVAWYWHIFTAPANPHSGGRYLLRFHSVDYKAEVWVNGKLIGDHEGLEEPFVLDATDAIKPSESNCLAVRVLSPTSEPIDGISMTQIPYGRRYYPEPMDCAYATGGIIDSVELLVVPSVRLEDLNLIPDWKTGEIHIYANIRNAGAKTVVGHLEFSVAPASGGATVAMRSESRRFPPGDSVVDIVLIVPDHHLWDLNTPYLYMVTARVQSEGSPSVDILSSRCGFRDFRLENGYFRLNGRRIRLHGALYVIFHYPIAQSVPHDKELVRRDVLNMKAMGFNFVRITCGAALPSSQLDIFDEVGLLACEEHMGATEFEMTPSTAKCWDQSILGVIKRDRNHPSIVMWSLLNEVWGGPVFREAVRSLPLIRTLDGSRMVILNSGRFDCIDAANKTDRLELWRNCDFKGPFVAHNPTKNTIIANERDTKWYAIASNTTWRPGQLSLRPGHRGEFSSVRWNCTQAGYYSLEGSFEGLAHPTTSNTYILHNGRLLHSGCINANEQENVDSFLQKLTLSAGDRIDFVVGPVSGDNTATTTGLSVIIKSASGKLYDASAEFSSTSNPNTSWSYGVLAQGTSPDTSTFNPYDEYVEAIDAASISSLSNTGSSKWDTDLRDDHEYTSFPLSAMTIKKMRDIGSSDIRPKLLSEHGVCGAQDYPQFLRHAEQLGKENAVDASIFRKYYGSFLSDWKQYGLDQCWARPEDFFKDSQQNQSALLLEDYNAWMANPNLIGDFSSTTIVDAWFHGCGSTSYFRELKLGMADVCSDVSAPVRWSLFVEPVNIYRGSKVRLEAVLVNLDAMKPGKYPVCLQVFGPKMERVFEKTISIEIPEIGSEPDPPFAQTVFSEDVSVDGPTGKYRFMATFERGAAAKGGDVEFFLTDPVDMPNVAEEVVLWGDDPELAKWLSGHNIRFRNFIAGEQTGCEVILAAGRPASPGGAQAFIELARHIARGSTVIFLTPETLLDTEFDGTPAKFLRWAPLSVEVHPRLSIYSISLNGYFRADYWAKDHPIFDGMPSGGMMDMRYYREIITSVSGLMDMRKPAEAVAGGIQASGGNPYTAILFTSVHDFGAGRFFLNTLAIRENLGKVPAAERLLRNMLNYAMCGSDKSLSDLPSDFDKQMKAMGYE